MRPKQAIERYRELREQARKAPLDDADARTAQVLAQSLADGAANGTLFIVERLTRSMTVRELYDLYLINRNADPSDWQAIHDRGVAGLAVINGKSMHVPTQKGLSVLEYMDDLFAAMDGPTRAVLHAIYDNDDTVLGLDDPARMRGLASVGLVEALSANTSRATVLGAAIVLIYLPHGSGRGSEPECLDS